MEKANVSRAMLAGLAATLAMTMMMYAAPLMGMPKMDIAAMLGSLVNGGEMPAPMSGPWWMGMMMHFVHGVVIFPLLYAYLLYRVLPGSDWVRGMLWGVILWLVAQMMVMPMMGMGFFSSAAPQPTMAVLGSLMGHLIYGAILGALAGAQAARLPQQQTVAAHPS